MSRCYKITEGDKVYYRPCLTMFNRVISLVFFKTSQRSTTIARVLLLRTQQMTNK